MYSVSSRSGGLGIAPIVIYYGVQAAIQLASFLIGRRKGPRQRIAASEVANEYESLMQQNLALWNSTLKTSADQRQALANFDQLWGEAKAEWEELGDPGEVAIQERDRGGTIPGTNGNWFTWYRDPIANAQVSTSTAGAVTSAVTTTVGGFGNFMLPVGIGLLLLALLWKKD